MNLAIYYPHPEKLRAAGAVAAASACLAFTWLAWQWRIRRPWMLVGWLWYVGTLVPVIGLVQVGSQALADRYTYIPTIGLLVLIVWTVEDATRARAGVLAVTAVALVTLGVLTFRQASTWKDTYSVFSHALQVTRNNGIAHAMVGSALIKSGKTDEAIAHLKDAVRIYPTYAEAQSNLGIALVAKGDIDAALPYLRRAASLSPSNTRVGYNLGRALRMTQASEEAASQLTKVVQIDPQYADAHFELGLALASSEHYPAAIEHLETAVRLAPEKPDYHQVLASVLMANDQIAAAMTEYRQSLSLRPDDAETMITLASILATHPDPRLRNGADAVRLAQRANELTRATDPVVLAGLAAAYAEAGRFPEAIAACQQSISVATAAGDSALVARGEQLLALFRAGRPFHRDNL
jgi:tetratricopeptide (TPR) repeat protein